MTGPLTGIDVLILAGGKGTRIKAVLGDTPKILAPINGRTMLDRQVERLIEAGADRIIVTRKMEEMIVRDSAISMGTEWSIQPPPAYETIIEPRPLGTVAAVRYAAHLLYSNPVVIINGDTWAEVKWLDYSKEWQLDSDLAYAIDEHGKNAGHYMVSQRWLHALVTSPYTLIEDALKQTPKKHRIKISSFIDIGTPEGLGEGKGGD